MPYLLYLNESSQECHDLTPIFLSIVLMLVARNKERDTCEVVVSRSLHQEVLFQPTSSKAQVCTSVAQDLGWVMKKIIIQHYSIIQYVPLIIYFFFASTQ